MSSSRLPPLLRPYVHPSALSLTLLTSVLGATANWLILRFLFAALNPVSGTPGTDDDASIHESRIVLVSFLRDWEFWRTEGRRAVGAHAQPCLSLAYHRTDKEDLGR